MIKKKMKCLFYSLITVLWIAVIVLFLELLGLLFQLRIEKHNPYIQAFKNNLVLPAEITQAVKEQKGETSVSSKLADRLSGNRLFVGDDSMKQVLEWGPRDISFSSDIQMTRRMLFPELSPAAREAFAQLNGELVFQIDRRYCIRKVYGVHKDLFTSLKRFLGRIFLSKWSNLTSVREALDETIVSSKAFALKVNGPDGDPLSLSLIPDKEGDLEDKCVYVFADMHPDIYNDIVRFPAPEESHWAIPSYRFKSDYHSEQEPSFYTNAFGFRDDASEIPKPAGTFRILCAGASTTEEGADNSTTYPNLLEKKLQKSLPGLDVDVVNAGIPGAFLHVMLWRLPDYLALEPDMVILHVGVNDIMRQYLRPAVNFLPNRSYFIRNFLPSLFAPSNRRFSEKHYEYMGFSLEILTELLQMQDIEVVYASIASPDPLTISNNARKYYSYNANSEWHMGAFSLTAYHEYIRSSNGLLKQLSEAHDVAYVPVDERISGSTDIFRDFCHMTPAGIEKKAQVLYEALLPLIQERVKK